MRQQRVGPFHSSQFSPLVFIPLWFRVTYRFVRSLFTTNDQKYATVDEWVGPFLNRLGKWKMFQKLSRQQTYSAKINDQLCQHHT